MKLCSPYRGKYVYWVDTYVRDYHYCEVNKNLCFGWWFCNRKSSEIWSILPAHRLNEFANSDIVESKSSNQLVHYDKILVPSASSRYIILDNNGGLCIYRSQFAPQISRHLWNPVS